MFSHGAVIVNAGGQIYRIVWSGISNRILQRGGGGGGGGGEIEGGEEKEVQKNVGFF